MVDLNYESEGDLFQQNTLVCNWTTQQVPQSKMKAGASDLLLMVAQEDEVQGHTNSRLPEVHYCNP